MDSGQGTRSKDVVTCFLSCSVRPADRPLVDAIERGVLRPMGFRCFTVGRNLSLPDSPDAAIKKLLGSCECLVGVATERLTATDRDIPDRTLSLATPYLLQETSMAYQAELPFLMMRTPGVSLVGVTRANLYLSIASTLRNGRVAFKDRKDAVYSALAELKHRALERRKALSNAEWKRRIGWLASIVVGAGVTAKAGDLLLRPSCFGDFYYKDPECRDCSYKPRCKAEKQLRRG